jgi:hypothetical protein
LFVHLIARLKPSRHVRITVRLKPDTTFRLIRPTCPTRLTCPTYPAHQAYPAHLASPASQHHFPAIAR